MKFGFMPCEFPQLRLKKPISLVVLLKLLMLAALIPQKVNSNASSNAAKISRGVRAMSNSHDLCAQNKIHAADAPMPDVVGRHHLALSLPASITATLSKMRPHQACALLLASMMSQRFG